MKRIGIIGCENSHAEHFAKIINLSQTADGTRLYPDMEVVAVYGPDIDAAIKVQSAGNVKRIVSSNDEFFGLVDAVMVTNRKGSLHADYARPFIEAGIPVFIDKPVTSNIEEAIDLVKLAKDKCVALAGGSGCKYSEDILSLQKQRDDLSSNGEFLSASMNFAADRDSEYDGFYFYAPHLTEMALTVFGFNPLEVQAYSSQTGVLAVLRYEDFDVSLHYTKDSQVSSCTLYGKQDNVHQVIDISSIYQHEVDRFVTMLRTAKMPQTYQELIIHVAVIEAIETSLSIGGAVQIQYI